MREKLEIYSDMMPPENMVILIPVWPAYRWLAPIMAKQLERFWPHHPPVRFCGMSALEAGEAGDLPHYPRSPEVSLTNWAALFREGVRQARAEGFELAYVIAEEHLPLAPCHEEHLNKTLPQYMEFLPAGYISLMGWDNRRYTSRSPVLDGNHHRLKHLVQDRDPRFHLHPALWRLEVLEACCDLALRDPSANGSAWHFEKINDKEASPHPQHWKRGAYQVHAASMSPRPLNVRQRAEANIECFIYHKLMALVPLIPHRGLARAFSRWVGFDDFFCDGPYPMFFSGVMAKGGLNSYCKKFLQRSDEGAALQKRIQDAQDIFQK